MVKRELLGKTWDADEKHYVRVEQRGVVRDFVVGWLVGRSGGNDMYREHSTDPDRFRAFIDRYGIDVDVDDLVSGDSLRRSGAMTVKPENDDIGEAQARVLTWLEKNGSGTAQQIGDATHPTALEKRRVADQWRRGRDNRRHWAELRINGLIRRGLVRKSKVGRYSHYSLAR